MSGKTIIITGSSSGIGKEAALQLLEDGADVILACINKKETKELIKNLPEKIKHKAHFIKLDLCSFTIIEKFVKKFSKKFQKLDILINNAGSCPSDFKLTEDGIESILQTNHVGHMYLSGLLLKYFDKDDGRIINVSSFSHIFSDISEKNITKDLYDIDFKNFKNNYYQGLIKRYILYCNTKKANLYFTSYLSEELELRNIKNIKVCSVMPGIVNTNISKPMIELFWYSYLIMYLLLPFLFVIAKTPRAGAQTPLHASYIEFEKLVNGGEYKDCKLDIIETENQDNYIRNMYINYSLFLINVIGGRQMNMAVK